MFDSIFPLGLMTTLSLSLHGFLVHNLLHIILTLFSLHFYIQVHHFPTNLNLLKGKCCIECCNLDFIVFKCSELVIQLVTQIHDVIYHFTLYSVSIVH